MKAHGPRCGRRRPRGRAAAPRMESLALPGQRAAKRGPAAHHCVAAAAAALIGDRVAQHAQRAWDVVKGVGGCCRRRAAAAAAAVRCGTVAVVSGSGGGGVAAAQT
jgi:hypothetical protein